MRSVPTPMIERLFRLPENQTSVRTEVLAGVTTFLTMAYIIFVQPAVLSGKMFGSDTGIDFDAVFHATRSATRSKRAPRKRTPRLTLPAIRL